MIHWVNIGVGEGFHEFMKEKLVNKKTLFIGSKCL